MTARPAFMFAADLDGTLLPNTGKPMAPGCLERTHGMLHALREAGVPVCFVTGRYLALAKKGSGLFRHPEPDWWVCNVGTEVYDKDGRPDAEWERLLGDALDRDGLRKALYAIPRLTVQEAAKQGRHKFSFYYPEPATPRLLGLIAQSLGELGSGLRLVSSLEEGSGRALLDLVPANAGKRHAVEYMAQRYGLSLDAVYFAGDSGNDLDVLLSGVCGTLVGNTPEEVRGEALRLQEEIPEASLYIAQANYGDGVIEGLRHYGFWSNGTDT